MPLTNTKRVVLRSAVQILSLSLARFFSQRQLRLAVSSLAAATATVVCWPFLEIPVRSSAHTHTVAILDFTQNPYFTRSESAAGRTRTVVAQTNRRGEGRRTFENQISGVQHFASATD